jgi:hypothetical protein
MELAGRVLTHSSYPFVRFANPSVISTAACNKEIEVSLLKQSARRRGQLESTLWH